MKVIKLVVIGLVISAATVVYAATADCCKPGAKCCKPGASCCARLARR